MQNKNLETRVGNYNLVCTNVIKTDCEYIYVLATRHSYVNLSFLSDHEYI